jgi:hypothetical protein
MGITYSIEVMNGISLLPLTRDTIRQIRRVAFIRGYYTFLWSIVDPAYAMLCDLRYKEDNPSETYLGIRLEACAGDIMQSPVSLADHFGNARTRIGVFQWQAGAPQISVCLDLLTHPFAMTPYRPFDNAAADELGLPRKKGNIDWSFAIHPDSSLVAVARCHSWECCNPVELWDSATGRLLHTIKDEKTASAATPKYDIAFNANGSLLYFSNGYESSYEIWGCSTVTVTDQP